MDQHDFSEEVSRIKAFEGQLRKYAETALHKNYITYKPGEEFLVFSVYRVGKEYCIKAAFSNFNYRFELP